MENTHQLQHFQCSFAPNPALETAAEDEAKAMPQKIMNVVLEEVGGERAVAAEAYNRSIVQVELDSEVIQKTMEFYKFLVSKAGNFGLRREV